MENITRPPTDVQKQGLLVRGKETADELIVVGSTNLRNVPKEKRVAMDSVELKVKVFELFDTNDRLQIDQVQTMLNQPRDPVKKVLESISDYHSQTRSYVLKSAYREFRPLQKQ